MSNGHQPTATAAADYTVRPYVSGDLGGALRVDRRVWNRDRSPKWFRWKYVENPFVDQPPVFVAEQAGQIIGVRPFLAVPLRLGESVVMALQPADTMVDPAHRRKGVFRQMTEYALEVYSESDCRLFFNFPNEYVRPGYLALGWRAVTPEETYYRIASPAAVAGNGLRRQAARLSRPALEGYYGLRSRWSSAVDRSVQAVEHSVTQKDGAAVDTLVELHDRCRPDRIHADRTERFLRWRLASPLWSRRTYLCGQEQPLAGVVARTRTTSDGVELTQIADVAPLCGGRQWETAVETALRAVVETHPETDLFAVSNGAIPHRVLASVGFVSDRRPPLSWFTSFESTLAVRPNAEPTAAEWTIEGRAIDQPDNWCVTFLERDTA